MITYELRSIISNISRSKEKNVLTNMGISLGVGAVGGLTINKILKKIEDKYALKAASATARNNRLNVARYENTDMSYKNYILEVINLFSDNITISKHESLYNRVLNMNESDARAFVEDLINEGDVDATKNIKTSSYAAVAAVKHPWEYAKSTGRFYKGVATGKLSKILQQDRQLSEEIYKKMQNLKNLYNSGKISKQEFTRRKNELEISILSRYANKAYLK